MKQPNPLLQGRRLYLACSLGVLALAVLFTLVGLLAPQGRGTGQPWDETPVTGVDVDVDHRRANPRHSPQQRQADPLRKPSPAPAVRSTPLRQP